MIRKIVGSKDVGDSATMFLAHPLVQIVERMPSAAEFLRLRADAGWRLPSDAAVSHALQRTLYAVCAEAGDGKAIGMGRIVGDGAVQFFITDVIVLSAWRNQEIGSAIMAALMDYVHQHATAGSFVGLFAARGRQHFYERFGFIVRPTSELGPGMAYLHRQGSNWLGGLG